LELVSGHRALAFLLLVAAALAAVVLAIVFLTLSGRTVEFPGLRQRSRPSLHARGSHVSKT
jgi:hypothetical protein